MNEMTLKSQQSPQSAVNVLSISLLGGLSLSYADQILPTPTPQKLISVLAYLVLRCQHPQDREEIAGRLWPDLSVAEARSNLRRHLYLLRQMLPAVSEMSAVDAGTGAVSWILTDRETVQWNPDAPFWLDIDEFKRCSGANLTQAFEACLELYQGDLLPELYDDWLIAEREELLALYLDMLRTAISYETECGRYSEALRYAHQWLARDPLNEEAHRKVMSLCYLAGDRPAALRQFEQCRDMLRSELDVEPMPATLKLYQQIVEQRFPTPVVQSLAAAPAQQAVVHPLPAEEKTGTPVSSRRFWLRRLLIWGSALLILAVIPAAYYGSRLAAQPDTLLLSGPAVAQDTWITFDFPDDLYWREDPYRTPHYSYSRAHLQYFEPQRAKDRILIRFDLAQLPAGAQVKKAVLEIYLETWIEPEVPGMMTEPYPASVSVYQITTPWQVDQATFNQPWSQPGLQAGVDYLAQPLDTQPISGTAWLAFDVTGAVQAWARQPASNQGLMIMISSAQANIAHYWVNMTDQPAPSLRPSLHIND